ncbi:hypothetical protein Poli38472_014197 [Pythium oligandrum]|uniref:Uncharacterized protein n=1 Tax=Pythium oligandrum TaxID=41045 RepID=A0A8K1FHN3_PYTOL|nr:hypothetical protein Poli38472_014197 [Pythium oligandrum]|eukprot:TMW64080.1 hypothetical protein Poli38472_014197 [Pythium oligandrum]
MTMRADAALFDPFQLSDSLPTPVFPPSPPASHPNVGVSPQAPSPSPPAARTTAVMMKKVITLDDVERDILKTHAHLPAETKRKMVKAEFKRLKHCETVRQSRVRKKNERKDLKKINEELEEELNHSLVEYRQRNDWSVFDESSWWDVKFKKFVHSIYEVRALRRENGELKDQLMLHDTIGEQLERLQEDFQIPEYLSTRPLLGTIHFKPLSVDEAREIMLDSHEQAQSFFRTMRWNQTAAEHEKTNGWTQYVRIQPDGRVQFNFTKRITTISAHELVQRSWDMYCDMNLYRGIYASVQRLDILQRINEDTLVFRRDLQESPESPIFRTIFLLFRIRVDNGYVICFRSHNPTVYADDDDDPRVQWMDMFYWLMVLDPPAPGPGQPQPHGCDVSYGGNLLDARSAQHAIRWKYQVAMTLLRWESNAVAPLFELLG